MVSPKAALSRDQSSKMKKSLLTDVLLCSSKNSIDVLKENDAGHNGDSTH